VQCATATANFNSYDLWHSHLGHPNPQTMWHATCATNGIEKLDIPMKTPLCSDCQIGKMPSRSFPFSDKWADKILEMVHCDLVEFPILSYNRHKYCLMIIDDYSGYGMVCLLRLKSDTATTFSTWVTWAEKQTGHSLLRVHSDRGGEFMVTIFKTFLSSKGVEQQLSILDHPQTKWSRRKVQLDLTWERRNHAPRSMSTEESLELCSWHCSPCL